jgi:hypothetical protein
MLVRRFGRPGLLGTVARTAVIAGTATATANALNRRQARNAEQDAEAAAYEQQQAMAPAAPMAAAAPADGDGLGDQLMKLAQLHQDGTLTDAEFTAAKQRLLG